MKALALSKKPRTYIPKDFRSEENPPKFNGRSLSRREYLQLQVENPKTVFGGEMNVMVEKLQTIQASLEEPDKSTVQSEEKQKVSEDERVRSALEALKGLDMNLITKSSLNNLDFQVVTLKKALSGWENVPADDGEMLEFSPDNIECLCQSLIFELFSEFTGALTEIERKNLDTPLLSQNGPETMMETGTAQPVEELSLQNIETVNQ